MVTKLLSTCLATLQNPVVWELCPITIDSPYFTVYMAVVSVDHSVQRLEFACISADRMTEVTGSILRHGSLYHKPHIYLVRKKSS